MSRPAPQEDPGQLDRVLGTTTGLARGAVPGLREGAGGEAGARARDLVTLSLDGRPLLGAHPFLEEGRMIVCCPAQSPLAPTDTGLAIGPLLGGMAAHLAKGGVLALSVQEVLSLDRMALSVQAGRVSYDPWSEFPRKVEEVLA